MKFVRFIDADGMIAEGHLIGENQVETSGGSVRTIEKLLAPVVPSAIIGIGQNYRRHAEEMGGKVNPYPVIFFKNPSSLQNPGDPIRLPQNLVSDSVDYECELAVVIGRPCLNATRENAFEFIRGYTCANDVSARDWQRTHGGGQWSRGKSFDTFCPLGPVLVTPDEILHPHQLRIRTLINEEAMQDWSTDDMIFDIPELIAFLSADTTLAPDTVILTGTPHGVGAGRKPPRFLQAGDVVTVSIEGIGELTNPVV